MTFKTLVLRRKLLFGLGVAALIPFQTASAASLSWSAGAGADLSWSAPLNWTPNGPPTSADAAIFTDTAIAADGATINNSVNASTTIQALAFKNNSGFHNTSIAAGSTLTISNSVAGIALGIGSESLPTANQTENASISGDASLVVKAPTGDIVVRQGSGAGSGGGKAILNLSALNSFTADVAHLFVGVASPPGYTSYNRTAGTLYLAKTNSIRASVSATNSPSIDVGKSAANNAGGSFLYLGLQNDFKADSFGFGRVKEAGVSMLFNPAFTADGTATAKFRSANGTNRVSYWAIGDGVTETATSSVRGTNDFTGGSVDAMVDVMVVGRASSGGTGAVVHKGVLTLEHGVMDVNSLSIGLQGAANAKSGDGTVNVNGDAQLKVNNSLQIGAVLGGTGAALTTGKLVVNGGTVSAPSITAGLDATTSIAISNGTLKLTSEAGSAGTVDAPIDAVTLDGATVEMSAGNGKIVTALLNVGANNTIKITGIPVIDQYPKTFTLIQATAASGPLNFSLVGGLPAGYVGTLINNDATGTVDLKLDSGPLPAIVTWSGAVNGDWDLTTQNWLKAGGASLFTKGDAAIFSDSAAGPTTINLTTALEPGAITVNNSAKTYTFAGSGSIGGAASLTKTGTGTLVLANSGSNSFNGGVTIAGGALQIGDGGVNGNLPSAPIVDNANLTFKHSDNITVNGLITGTGSLTQDGSGTLTLAGENAYAGGTIVNSGKVVVTGTLPNTTGINVGASASLSGSATLTAPVVASGTIDPGNGTAAGTLTTGPLTLNAGASLKFDLNTDPTAGANINDQLVVSSGGIVANNNSVTVNFLGLPTLGVPYNVINYAGAKVGALASAVKGTHYTATLDQATSGQVNVTLTGEAASLKWNSTADGTWDNTALNWLKTGGGLDAFFTGDAVLFDDSVAGVQTALTIPAGAVIVPGSVTVNSTNNYTISGSGKISGSTGISKSGSGTFTIATSNDFTGVVDVNAGTLKAGSTTSLGAGGTANGNTVIHAGATLDVNGIQLNGESIEVSGSGVGNAGAVVNSGAQQINAVGRVTLDGDTTLGGSGRWDLRGGGATLSANGNAYSLVKVGTNQISFVAATIDPALANVEIKEGVFAIQTTTASLSIANGGGGFGDPNGTITIRGGATLNTYNLGAASPLNKKISVDAGGTIWNENSVSVLAGPIALNGAANVNAAGTSLQIDGVISGSGGLNKTGNSPLILNANDTYTGATTINSGAIQLTDNGSISSSATVDIRSGATLNASARSDATFTVASGQTLTGSGTINGSLNSSAGSTVAPGPASGVGTLTVTGDAQLNGTTAITVDPSNHTNDVIKAGSATLGGTLNIAATGAFQGGDTFKIVDAASISGGFTAITPSTPGLNQVWDTTKLLVDGTIKVVGNALPKPTLGATGVANGNFNLNGSGGTVGLSYKVLATSDISVPLANWTIVANGTFDANGNFNASIPVDTAPYRFFVVTVGAN